MRAQRGGLLAGRRGDLRHRTGPSARAAGRPEPRQLSSRSRLDDDVWPGREVKLGSCRRSGCGRAWSLSAAGPSGAVRFIVDVRPVPQRAGAVRQVDNADHLYLAGRVDDPDPQLDAGAWTSPASAAVKHNMASAIFSLEMSKIEIIMRLLSAEARVPLHVLRSGQLSDDDWTRLARRMGEISEAPLFVDDSPNMTLMEIRAKARRLKQRTISSSSSSTTCS